MIWWHAATSEALRAAYRPAAYGTGPAAGAGRSQVALHRPAEFNKSHVPAFLADEEPRA